MREKSGERQARDNCGTKFAQFTSQLTLTDLNFTSNVRQRFPFTSQLKLPVPNLSRQPLAAPNPRVGEALIESGLVLNVRWFRDRGSSLIVELKTGRTNILNRRTIYLGKRVAVWTKLFQDSERAFPVVHQFSRASS